MLPGDDEPNIKWLFSETGPALGEKMRLLIGAAMTDPDRLPDPRMYDDGVIAAEIGMSSASAWSKAKSGRLAPGRREYLKAYQLRDLAHYFGLHQPGFFGPEAWRFFTPECSVADFHAALMRVGYGNFRLHRSGQIGPVDELLDWMTKHCGMTRLGIRLTNPELPPPQAGPRRGPGAIDFVTEQEESERSYLYPNDDFVVRVDAPAGAHIVLLQLGEQLPPPFFALHCLVPSYRHADTLLPPNGLLPTGPDVRGRRGFAVGPEVGRFDLLALVTANQPLALPFRMPGSMQFHRVEPMRELSALKQSLASAAGSRLLSVHHLPIRVAK